MDWSLLMNNLVPNGLARNGGSELEHFISQISTKSSSSQPLLARPNKCLHTVELLLQKLGTERQDPAAETGECSCMFNSYNIILYKELQNCHTHFYNLPMQTNQIH